MTNYTWIIQSEKYIGYVAEGRKAVRITLAAGPTVTNASTPPYGVQFNASGLLEINVASLDEVTDFQISKNYLPTNNGFVYQLNAWKDTQTPPASGTYGLTTNPKNGIILNAKRSIFASGMAWAPVASGDLAASSIIVIEAWGI